MTDNTPPSSSAAAPARSETTRKLREELSRERVACEQLEVLVKEKNEEINAERARRETFEKQEAGWSANEAQRKKRERDLAVRSGSGVAFPFFLFLRVSDDDAWEKGEGGRGVSLALSLAIGSERKDDF